MKDTARPHMEVSLRRSRVSDFIQLTKPRITMLVLVTTFMGFYLASRSGFDFVLLLHTILGTALVASGASALNQYFERELDSRMMRTRNRPIPDGRLQPFEALAFAGAISIAGVQYLAVAVNLLTAALALLTLIAYVFVYTPLKTRTGWCTLVGAVPGAIPPMMGWTAVRNELDLSAWSLFAILFVWQMPHFFAISWIFGDDYARGGFSILSGKRTIRQILFFCGILLPISVLPVWFSVVGVMYLAGALILGLAYLAAGIALAISHSQIQALRLLRVSVIYLPALLALMMIDKV